MEKQKSGFDLTHSSSFLLLTAFFIFDKHLFDSYVIFGRSLPHSDCGLRHASVTINDKESRRKQTGYGQDRTQQGEAAFDKSCLDLILIMTVAMEAR